MTVPHPRCHAHIAIPEEIAQGINELVLEL
jgi:hypothetical protein